MAWLAFLYALRLIEPSLVQILYSGIGPLSVVGIDRHLPGAVPAVPLTRVERPIYVGLLVSLVFAAAVALGGFSGAGAQPVGVTALGVMLAASGGVAISVSTMLCRKLNDAGVPPSILLSLRYPVTMLSAAVLASQSASGLPTALSIIDDPQPYHVDEEQAKQTGVGRLFAPSILTLAISVRLSHESGYCEISSVAGLGIDELRMRKPVLVDDELNVKATVVSMRESKSRPGLGVMTTRIEVINQNGEVVLSYLLSGLVNRRPQ